MTLWRIEQLSTRRAELDFTSSGQGRPTVTQLVADGEVIANATEYATWSGRETQVEVCAECGTEHCQPGGWVSIRGAGDSVLWIPAFEAMTETDLDPDEFAPPDYIARRGIPFFEEATLRRVGHVPAVSSDAARPVSRRELALTLQWIAPGRALGALPAPPRTRRDNILSCGSDGLATTLDALDDVLAAAFADRAPAALRARNSESRSVELLLDLPDRRQWSPAAVRNGRLVLALGNWVESK